EHENSCDEAGKQAVKHRPPPAREIPQQDDGEAEQDQCGDEGGEPARRQRGPHPGGRESDGPQFRVGVHCGKLRLRTVAMPPPAAVPSPNLSLGDWSVVPRLRRRYGDVSPLPPLFARLCPASAAVPSPTSWGTDPVGQFPVRTTLMTASAARTMLERISQPSDLRQLSPDELVELCEEIREFILEKVSMTGGHLSPNLGVVELTVALHRS